MGKNLKNTKGTYDRQPKWEDEVEWIDFKDGKDHRVRMVGDFNLMARQWVVTKKGKFFPVWSPKFNPDSETMDLDNPDPMYDDFNKFPQVLMISNVIDRDLQQGGRDPNPVRGIMVPASVIIPTLKKIMNLIQADPADPEKGVDLMITFNPQGAGVQKWSVINGAATPLEPHEDPNNSSCKFKYYDFEKVCPDFSTDQESAQRYYRTLREGMGRNYYYVKKVGKASPGENPWSAFKPDMNGHPYNSFPELEGYPKPGEKGGYDPGSQTRSTPQPVDDEELPPKRESQEKPASPSSAEVSNGKSSAGSNGKNASSGETEQIHPDIPNIDHPEHGVVPECFTQYDGTAKCKKCPVRVPCLKFLPEDEDGDDL